MRVALAQVASPTEERVADRHARVAEVVRGAAGADLIVLPELWTTGYNHFDRYQAEAEGVDGVTVKLCAELARELNAYIHIGSIVEPLSNGSFRNTAILLDANGEIVHTYSKVHVFGYQSKEAELLQAGEDLRSAESPFGMLAATTCYDLRFPGLWTELGNTGAEIIIVPAAWPAVRREHWRLLTSARALDNQVFLLGCNASGNQSGVDLAGHSRVVDPWGTVVGELGPDEGVLIADIDPAVVEQTRREFPVLKDRLPDYRELNDQRKKIT